MAAACLAKAVILMLAAEELEAQAKKKKYVKKWIKNKSAQGCYDNLMRELAMEDSNDYRRFIRMDVETFNELASMIHPLLKKQDTHMREAISPEEKLALTLRYLATGETQRSLGFQFRIGQSTISNILIDCCKAIHNVLRSNYMRVPNTEEEWKLISNNFNEKWNFPNCIGALDGKHIIIEAPSHSGSHYRNYKGTFSIVLMALVDADLKFIYIDIGTNDRISDGGVWNKCKLKRAIESNLLNIPSSQYLPNTNILCPYVIVADEAFGLKEYLMRPYSSRDLDNAKRIFNYRLSRARGRVENAFGILAAQWRVFKQPLRTTLERAVHIVLAACVLHNFLRSKLNSKSLYSPENLIDYEDICSGTVIPGQWRNASNAMINLTLSQGHNNSREAKIIRNNFCNYFNTVGQVPWQWKHCVSVNTV